MKIEIKNWYSVTQDKEFDTTIELDLVTYIKSNDYKIHSLYDVKMVIDRILEGENILLYLPEDIENGVGVKDGVGDGSIDIINLSEIFRELEIEGVISKRTCCDNHGFGNNFCPKCGKPIVRK